MIIGLILLGVFAFWGWSLCAIAGQAQDAIEGRD